MPIKMVKTNLFYILAALGLSVLVLGGRVLLANPEGELEVLDTEVGEVIETVDEVIEDDKPKLDKPGKPEKPVTPEKPDTANQPEKPTLPDTPTPPDSDEGPAETNNVCIVVNEDDAVDVLELLAMLGFIAFMVVGVPGIVRALK